MMKKKFLLFFILIFSVLISCRDKKRDIIPVNLENFSAQSSGYQQIEVTVDFPADTATYASISIYRSLNAFPNCGEGTLVQKIIDFSVDPLIITDNVGNSLTWYYRACPISVTLDFSPLLATTTASGGHCLIAGTQIATDLFGHSKNIEDIEIGDQVISYNSETETLEEKQVTRTFKSETEVPYGILNLSNDVNLGVTETHPIFVESSASYVLARNLETHNSLVFLDFNHLSLVDVLAPIIFDQGPDWVYSIRVEDHHNFFANGILVHNK